MPLIKRYPNRKLYDTEAKQYVTLEEIANMVRQGLEIQVIDHVTGEDLTALTMTQIIFELEKNQSGFFPRNLLSGLVRTGGDKINHLQRSVAQTLGLTALVDEEIKRRLDDLVTRGELLPEQSLAIEEILLGPSASASLKDGAQPWAENSLYRALQALGIPSRNELQKLNQQLEALAAKIDEIASE
ncbi:MAG: hypothetical protein OHK0052_02080 [Anaerolineales bacterium]